MVTCNLNSISLGRISDEELEENIALQIRMLDNVISINQAPVPESRMTSDKYRAIGSWHLWLPPLPCKPRYPMGI